MERFVVRIEKGRNDEKWSDLVVLLEKERNDAKQSDSRGEEIAPCAQLPQKLRQTKSHQVIECLWGEEQGVSFDDMMLKIWEDVKAFNLTGIALQGGLTTLNVGE